LNFKIIDNRLFSILKSKEIMKIYTDRFNCQRHDCDSLTSIRKHLRVILKQCKLKMYLLDNLCFLLLGQSTIYIANLTRTYTIQSRKNKPKIIKYIRNNSYSKCITDRVAGISELLLILSSCKTKESSTLFINILIDYLAGFTL
jgi:hypothetical protein